MLTAADAWLKAHAYARSAHKLFTLAKKLARRAPYQKASWLIACCFVILSGDTAQGKKLFPA